VSALREDSPTTETGKPDAKASVPVESVTLIQSNYTLTSQVSSGQLLKTDLSMQFYSQRTFQGQCLLTSLKTRVTQH
jgi:hypothetical protein